MAISCTLCLPACVQGGKPLTQRPRCLEPAAATGPTAAPSRGAKACVNQLTEARLKRVSHRPAIVHPAKRITPSRATTMCKEASPPRFPPISSFTATVHRTDLVVRHILAAYGGYTKTSYGAQGGDDSGGFFAGGSQPGSQSGGGKVGSHHSSAQTSCLVAFPPADQVFEPCSPTRMSPCGPSPSSRSSTPRSPSRAPTSRSTARP